MDVEIQLLEQKIAEAETQLERLEQDIVLAKYEEQLREKSASIRHKEGDKDKVASELSALNRQADSRAQLAIKRNEVAAKKNQVDASYVVATLLGVPIDRQCHEPLEPLQRARRL